MTTNYLSPSFQRGGRLGNVMFTLAAAYVHSLKTGAELRVPWDFNQASQLLGEFLQWPFPATVNGQNEPAAWKEPHFHFAPIPTSIRSGGLSGFFQSWKYFEGYEDEVRKLFGKFISVKVPRTVGIHIRLGDYKYQSFKHRTADNAFIGRALAELKGKTTLKGVYLFSDEPAEAASRLFRVPGIEGKIVGSCCSVHEPQVDITGMTCCENMIISASTFSWWGAWLGQAERVYAPMEWFTSTIDDYQDVCPPDWILL